MFIHRWWSVGNCAQLPKFLSISFVRQIRLPRFAGEANLPPELLATHLVYYRAPADGCIRQKGQTFDRRRSALIGILETRYLPPPKGEGDSADAPTGAGRFVMKNWYLFRRKTPQASLQMTTGGVAYRRLVVSSKMLNALLKTTNPML